MPQFQQPLGNLAYSLIGEVVEHDILSKQGALGSDLDPHSAGAKDQHSLNGSTSVALSTVHGYLSLQLAAWAQRRELWKTEGKSF